jgi:hypothetical protein
LEKICIINKRFKSVNYAFGPMILLDPGSLAFDHPEKFGYKLVFRNLKDYVMGMSMSSWHQWVSYETKFLDRAKIVDLIIKLIEHSINLREKHGIPDRIQAFKEHIYYVLSNRLIIQKVEEAMKHPNELERQLKLRMLKETIDKHLIQLAISNGI